jgi:hypothetical protein
MHSSLESDEIMNDSLDAKVKQSKFISFEFPTLMLNRTFECINEIKAVFKQ